ncbi:hypothetical protein J1614_001137, partial [Plenodomus biglobosus]
MVQILSITALLLTIALGVEASHRCQCLFPNRGHCCATVLLFLSVNGPTEDCTDVCRNASRMKDGVRCNSGGQWSNVSAWNVRWREPCN